MKVVKKTFGMLSNGKKVYLYTLKAGDITLCLSTFGAAWTSLKVPSQKNGKADVLLGFSGLDGYLNNGPYLGVTVGRFANRISGGNFSLNGKEYRLDVNDNGNTLHSGRKGFDKKLWNAESYEESDGVFVRFTLDSPDGEGGFPGNLSVAVTYGLTKSNEVVAKYEAKASAPTPVNLTNHAYFNLAGEDSGSIMRHELCLYCSSFLEVTDTAIPTGKLLPVRNTPFDFRTRKPIGQDTNEGYDHCFTVDGDPGKLRPCAEVFEPDSGRSMKVCTTQPGVQFYTGNMLPGFPYAKHTGFCLETQHFPDSPHQPDFPSCVFGPDRDYNEKSIFMFEIK
jgi:aldose 1-epimerase